MRYLHLMDLICPHIETWEVTKTDPYRNRLVSDHVNPNYFMSDTGSVIEGNGWGCGHGGDLLGDGRENEWSDEDNGPEQGL